VLPGLQRDLDPYLLSTPELIKGSETTVKRKITEVLKTSRGILYQRLSMQYR
jgi:hypothetical protein